MCTLFRNLYMLSTCMGSPYGLHGVLIYILYLSDQMWLVGDLSNSDDIPHDIETLTSSLMTCTSTGMHHHF